MFPEESFVRQVLHDNGLSATRPRLMVIRALWEQKPLTMRQLTGAIDERMDRVTIYRTIQNLEKAGLLQRISMGWKYQIELAGPFSHHHHHLTCLNCRKVVAIADRQIEQMFESLAEAHQFSLTDHQLELQGFCASCRKRSPSTTAIKVK